MNKLNVNPNKGTVLIIAFVIMGVLMISGVYFLSFTLTESRIAKSQTVGTQTYYLAEAGINEAVWKLKYDDVWKTCFVTSSDAYGCPECKGWTASFTTSTDVLLPDSSITVTIQNSTTACAQGWIIATSTIALPGGKTAQRAVKTKVLRDLGSLTEDSPLFAGSPSGESNIKNSTVNIYNGNMYVRNNLNMQTGSTLNVAGKVLVVGNVIHPERINASGTCGADICDSTSTCECTNKEVFDEWCQPGKCPPKEINMPPVDFDSYYSKADLAQQQIPPQCSVLGKKIGQDAETLSNQCVFTEEEFADLLDEVGMEGTLILEYKTNGSVASTYYVKGGLTLGGGRHLEINGVLVADKSVYIGTWDNAYLIIKDPGPGIPSGLLTQKKMNFDKKFLFWYEEIDVEGLLYSRGGMSIESILHAFTVKGGIIARKFDFDSGQLNPLNIYLDNDIIREGVWGRSEPPAEGPIVYSPVVTIEHWEESY